MRTTLERPSLYVTPEQHAEIKRRAEEEQTTVSELLRRLIRQFLAERTPDQPEHP